MIMVEIVNEHLRVKGGVIRLVAEWRVNQTMTPRVLPCWGETGVRKPVTGPVSYICRGIFGWMRVTS